MRSAEIHKATTSERFGTLRGAIFWLTSTTIVWQAVTWGLTLATARILKPADYGIAALAETITPVLALIAGFNISTWLIHLEAFDEKVEEAALPLAVLLGAAATAIALLAAPLLSAFYGKPELTAPFRLVAFVFMLQGLQTLPMARLQKTLRFKPIALMNLTVGISRALLQFVLALLGYQYWALFIGILYNELARSIWLVATDGLPRKLRWNWQIGRSAMAFGLPATAASLLWIVYSTADNVVVAKLFSTETLGNYAMAFFLTDLPLAKVNSVIRPTLLPYFAQLRENREQLFSAFFDILRAFACIVYPVLVGLFTVAPEAVLLLFGPKWAGLVQPLQVMCCVGLLRAITTNTEPLLLALGKPRSTLAANAVNACVLPPSFALMGSWFGIRGIYATWLVIFPITSFFALQILERATGITPLSFLKNLRSPLIASLIMGTAVAAVGAALGGVLSPVPIVATKAAVGIISYLASAWILFRKEAVQAVRIVFGLRQN
jgi:O-antigen/teichoic acid export membrane protein